MNINPDQNMEKTNWTVKLLIRLNGVDGFVLLIGGARYG